MNYIQTIEIYVYCYIYSNLNFLTYSRMPLNWLHFSSESCKCNGRSVLKKQFLKRGRHIWTECGHACDFKIWVPWFALYCCWIEPIPTSIHFPRQKKKKKVNKSSQSFAAGMLSRTSWFCWMSNVRTRLSLTISESSVPVLDIVTHPCRPFLWKTSVCYENNGVSPPPPSLLQKK